MEELKVTELTENEAAEATGGRFDPILGDQNPYITVQPGDTLASIARRYNVSIDQLCRANYMRGTDTVRPGQILKLWK